MRYQVLDLGVDGHLALLLDADGRVHVVRLAGCGLERGALLSGRRAKLGAHVLVAEHQRVLLHGKFESVACSQEEALALMHPVGKGSTGFPTRPMRTRTGVTHEFA